MCGIAGLFRPNGKVAHEDQLAVRRMIAAERHRGPDDEGYYDGPETVLGHARLSILDLSPAGRQPMSTPDGRLWLTYNGEIGNFRELRAELSAAGRRARSQTDSEVVLLGFEAWGISGLLSRLRGMFAFAILDRRQETAPRLFLVRDRFGIKPLYYCETGTEPDRTVSFASEPFALVASVASEEIDPVAVTDFLRLGSVSSPRTIFRQVRTLPPASCLVVDREGQRLERYWSCSAEAVIEDDPATTIRRVERALGESVALNMISDVPLGVFLSGGTDSAAVTALASELSEEALTTVSVVLDDAELNESGYAAQVAARFGTRHREIPVTSDDFMGTLDRVLSAMQQPTIDGFNSFVVSEAAKRAGLTVVLSGLGGDEVFLGYPHYRQLQRLTPILSGWSRLPAALRALPLSALSLWWSLWPGGGEKNRSRARKLAHLREPTAEGLYRFIRGLFGPLQIEKLLGQTAPPPPVTPTESVATSSSEGWLRRIQGLELDHYLHDQLLRDTDHMSMAHSVEVRVPLLDHRLFEIVASIPDRLKLASGVNKPLLVRALAARLDRNVWDRPKAGFTLPFERWLREFSPDLKRMSLEGGMLVSEAVAGIWREFDGGRLHWSRPWSLLVLSQFVSSIGHRRRHLRSLPLSASRPTPAPVEAPGRA